MKRFLVALTALMLLFAAVGCIGDPPTPSKKLPFEKKYESYDYIPGRSFTFEAKTGDFHYYLYRNESDILYLLAFNDKDGKEWDEDREPFMAKKIVLNSDFEDYKKTASGMEFITREGYYGIDFNILCIEGTYDMLSEDKEYRSEFAGWTALISTSEYRGLASSLYLLNLDDNIEGKVNFNVPEEYRTGEKNLISTLAALGEWDSGRLPKMSDETKNKIFG